jgi:hypothetical protein
VSIKLNSWMLVIAGTTQLVCRVVEMAQLVIGERSVVRLFCTQAKPVLVSAADLELMGLSGSSGRLYVSKAQRARNILVRLETVTITELSVALDSEDRYEYRYVW